MDIQNEKAYKNVNKQKFFNYVHSSSETYYRVAFPVLAQTNRSFYSYFADYLQLECTITYLKNNILTNIYLIDKQQKILFPLEKITCFFSDIPLGPKDTIQFSISSLADWHLKKYSPSNVDAWTKRLEEVQTTYSSIPEKYQKLKLKSLKSKKQNSKMNVNTIKKGIIDIQNEALEVSPRLVYVREALELLLAKKNKILLKRTEKYKKISSAIESSQIFNALAQDILKENFKSNISFKILYKAIQNKKRNRNFKKETQKIILLELLTIQMFSPYLNTDIHKNMLLSLLEYNRYNQNDHEQLNAMIHTFKENTPNSCESDWNKTYKNLWSEKDFKKLTKSNISAMLTAYTGLGLPYLPITLDGTLHIELSNRYFAHYYANLKIFKKKVPSMLLKNIAAINRSICNETFISACSLFGTTFFDIPIKFNFIDISFIKDDALTINESFCRNNFSKELNKLFNHQMYANTSFTFKHIHTINLHLSEDCMKDLNKNTISFIATFLRKQTKKDNQLPMNSTLLPLLKYKDTETFKTLFEGINTIVCHAPTTSKDRAVLLNEWFLATNSESTTDYMQLKIVAPSETIKKDFENSLYLTLFYSAIVTSHGYDTFLPPDKNTLKESYVFFMSKETMYKLYISSPYVLICLIGLIYLWKDITHNNVENMQCYSSLISLIFSLVNDYFPDTKRLLISKLLHYIFISMIVYNSIFIYRSCVLNSIIAFILIDYHHINKSSLFFNLMHAGIQTIKNRSCKPSNIHIEVEQISSDD